MVKPKLKDKSTKEILSKRSKTIDLHAWSGGSVGAISCSPIFLLTLYTKIIDHFHVNIARFQVQMHVTCIIQPIFILIKPISLKFMLSILHIG
jgi:hypothetical protein